VSALEQTPPAWAFDRLDHLVALDTVYQHKSYNRVACAFAAYIAAHEPAPVDPLRAEAIALVISDEVGRTANQEDAIRRGEAGQHKVNLAFAALRRGIELAKSEKGL
jgi:hypothetical protein